MRRLLLVLALAAGLAVSLLPVAAQATSGCQAFGHTAATESQLERPLGHVISAAAPANDDVDGLKQAACG